MTGVRQRFCGRFLGRWLDVGVPVRNFLSQPASFTTVMFISIKRNANNVASQYVQQPPDVFCMRRRRKKTGKISFEQQRSSARDVSHRVLFFSQIMLLEIGFKATFDNLPARKTEIAGSTDCNLNACRKVPSLSVCQESSFYSVCVFSSHASELQF